MLRSLLIFTNCDLFASSYHKLLRNAMKKHSRPKPAALLKSPLDKTPLKSRFSFAVLFPDAEI
jgi:hypothetical protein